MSKVSIIVPVYNGERYIDRFANCISSQDTDNFELIFINDGSTDATGLKLDGIKQKLNVEISVIHQGNRGVSAARNVGVEHSNGDIICFCDIDDVITNDYISTFLCLMEDSNVDVGVCNSKVIKGACTKAIHTSDSLYNISYMTSEESLKAFLYMKRAFCVWGVGIRKKLITDNNIRFEEGYKYNEDLHYMWQVLSYTRLVALIDKTMYFYIWHDGSAMAKFERTRFDGYHLMKKLEGFFEQNRPDFYPLFKKYVAARLMWSIVRQAASFFGSYTDFSYFFKEYNVKDEMKKLLSYPNFLIKFSSFIYICSPFLFYKIVGAYGQKTTHFINKQ